MSLQIFINILLYSVLVVWVIPVLCSHIWQPIENFYEHYMGRKRFRVVMDFCYKHDWEIRRYDSNGIWAQNKIEIVSFYNLFYNKYNKILNIPDNTEFYFDMLINRDLYKKINKMKLKILTKHNGIIFHEEDVWSGNLIFNKKPKYYKDEQISDYEETFEDKELLLDALMNSINSLNEKLRKSNARNI